MPEYAYIPQLFLQERVAIRVELKFCLLNFYSSINLFMFEMTVLDALGETLANSQVENTYFFIYSFNIFTNFFF